MKACSRYPGRVPLALPFSFVLICTILTSTIPRIWADSGPPPPGLDLRFRPAHLLGTEDEVRALARQVDGKVLIGGAFRSVNGFPCNGLARLNADGSLDSDFRFAYEPIQEYGHVAALLVQPDGKILVGGYGHSLNINRKPAGLLRLNSDGSLDSSFKIPELRWDSAVLCLALLNDGKILAGGEFDSANGLPRHGLARFHADGTVDENFPDLPFRAGDSDGVYTMALQSDGKIILGGLIATEGWPYDMARLNSAGSIDPSFTPPALTEGRVHEIAVQPDGKILVCAGGFGSPSGGANQELVRLNPDGKLDTTFQGFTWPEGPLPMSLALQPDGRIVVGANGGGVVVLQSDGMVQAWVKALIGQVNDITIEPNGGILLAGRVWDPANKSLVRWGAVRLGWDLRPDHPGALDLSFDPTASGGGLGLAQGTVDIVGLAEQPDGKVIVAGKLLGVDGFPRTTLARLNQNGSLDSSFYAAITVEPSFEMDVLVQPDSKILVTGERLLRLNSNGTVDSSFHSESSGGIRAFALQPDGKIVIAGWGETGYVARLNPDGTTDTSFARSEQRVVPGAMTLTPGGNIVVVGSYGGSGFVWRVRPDGAVDPNFSVSADGQVCDVSTVPGGGVVIGGTFSAVAGQSRLGVARLTEQGEVDPSFVPQISSVNPHAFVFRLKVLESGEVIIAGLHPYTFANGWSTGNGYLLLMKLDASGNENSTFSAQLGQRLWMQYNYGRSLLVQKDGAILVGGNLPDRGLLRVLFDGRVDAAFQPNLQGEPGIVETLELTADGKLYVQGRFSTVAGAPRPGLARLNSNGTFDAAFVPQLPAESRALSFAQGVDGWLVVATGKGYFPRGDLVRLDSRGSRDFTFAPVLRWSNELATVNCVCVQPDRRILVAGRFTTVNEVPRRGLARLNLDGTLDSSFNPGAGPQSLYGESSTISVLTLQPDGKILVGGTFTRMDGAPRHLLARLNIDGSVDTSFVPEFSDSYVFYDVKALTVQPDGKILVGFRVDVESGPRPGLVRLTLSGALDPEFAVGPGLSDRNEVAAINAVVLEPDGTILVGGKFEVYDGVPRVNLARLFPDGQVDTSFEVLWGYPPPGILWWTPGEVFDLAWQEDGKILAGGDFASIETQTRWGVARFLGGPSPVRLPKIVSQPLDQTVALGGTATFAVDAVGMGPFGFQWQKEGVNLPNQTNAILTLSGAAFSDAGAYRVLVSNSSGIIQSTPASLTVMPATAPSAPREQRMPAVAASRDAYLVAWAERRNGESNGWDIYAARITFGGKVLDPGGIRLCSVPQDQTSPRVASDGRDFLVVWEDARGLLNGGTDFDIYGAWVTIQGQVLQTNGFAISRAPRAQYTPSVAWNGQEYLVAWTDLRASTPALTEFDIWCARVRATGGVVDSNGIPVCTAAGLQNAPGVSAEESSFFVCWNDLRSEAPGIRGTTVRSDGAVEIPDGGWFSSLNASFGPAVDELNWGQLLVWVHNPPVSGAGSEVWATITGHPSGGPRDQWLLNRTAEYQGSCDVATRSNRFLAVWMQERFDGLPTRIWATRGGPSSLAASNLFALTTQADPLGWNGPRLCASTAGYAVAWVIKQPDQNGSSDIMLTRVSPAGVVLDTDGILVSRASRQVPEISWPAPTPIVYGVPLGAEQLNATANVPGRFVYTPEAGTFLGAGSQQTLTTVFIPEDPQTYATTAAQVKIDVSPAPLLIIADNYEKRHGAPNPLLTATYKWLVAGDTPASLDHPVRLTTTAATESPPGEYPITVSGAADPNYSITFSNGVLVVHAAGTEPGSLDLAINANLAEGARVNTVARQPDGKIIAGGWFRTLGDVARTNLARFNSDGTVDPSFFALGLCGGEFYSAALEDDGKIIVGMEQPSCVNSLVLGLLRLNSDGSWDSTFHPGGGIEQCWGGVRSVAIQPDGRILAGGRFKAGKHETLARFLADGRIDESFDAGQMYVWETDDYVIYDLIVQQDAKILVRGDISKVQERPVNGFFRLSADGKLDANFAHTNAWITSVASQTDGKILVGGTPDGQLPLGLYRLNQDGSVDSTFEQTGTRRVIPTALAVQPDGKIIGAGYGNPFSETLVVRHEPDGALDTSFDSGEGPNGGVSRLLVLPEHVLVAGWFTEFDGVPRQGLAWLHNTVPEPQSFVQRSILGFLVELASKPPESTLAWAVEEVPPLGWTVTNITHGGVWDRATGKVKFGPFFDAKPRTLSYKVQPPPDFTGVGLFAGQASADGKSSIVSGDTRIVITTEHPADRNPADWKLTMDEATGYAAAWRAGEDWPVPPNPIPVDYVTRASALWRGGETYKLDPSVEGPPLWWVNTDATTLRQDGDPQPFEVIRRVPSVYTPGEPLEAAIHVTVAPVFRAYAVEEHVPAGWQVGPVSDGGQLDRVNGLIKWGPFNDVVPRTLRYTLLPPVTARGRTDLAGSASFDGVLTRIGGCNQLYPSSRLTWSRRQAQPGWVLQLRGAIGDRYVIERSTDLASWTAVVTVTNQSGSVELPDVAQPGAGNWYYRARLIDGN